MPYPPSLELDTLLRPAIGARDLDRVLQIVKRYSLQHPEPPRPLLAPQPGLLSQVERKPGARTIPQGQDGDWFHLLLYNAGNACLRAGEYALAIEVYKQALIGCSHASVFNNIGCALKLSGRYREALSWFRKAVAQDATYNIGRLRVAGVIIIGNLPGDPLAELQEFVDGGGTLAEVEEYLGRADDEHRAKLVAVFGKVFPLEEAPASA